MIHYAIAGIWTRDWNAMYEINMTSVADKFRWQ